MPLNVGKKQLQQCFHDMDKAYGVPMGGLLVSKVRMLFRND